jgi:Xaa-Pro aminopeptidase
VSAPDGLVAAQRTTKEVTGEVVAALRPGLTERDVAALAERLARGRGASGFWTPVAVGAGEGSRVCHPDHPPGNRTIEEQDLVLLDVTPTFDGWPGDYCVSVVLGDDPERRELVATVERLRDELIAACRPGLPANELFGVAAAAFAREGVELLDLLANIGHSLEREFAEHGFIDASNATPMWGGWTIEPHVGRGSLGAKVEEILWLEPGGVSVVAA